VIYLFRICCSRQLGGTSAPTAPHFRAVRLWPSEITEPRSASYVTDFLATSDGLSLARAFMLVENPKLRRAIVWLVEEIAPERA
jgi:hypothetical protein